MKFPDRAESPAPGYFFEVLAFGISEQEPVGLSWPISRRSPRTHGTTSMPDLSSFMSIEGSLGIHYQSEEYVLHTGDSVYFDASEPHSYYGQTDLLLRRLSSQRPRVCSRVSQRRLTIAVAASC